MNLVSNGLKFNRSAEPRVEVAARRDGAVWHFEVTDNGIGIPPEYRDRVFGVFKRLHTRDAYAGTGIGLAICQRVVERHNGAIWVRSGPQGHGTAMCFTLPAGAEEGALDA
jgi:signal transduction histidine kinase